MSAKPRPAAFLDRDGTLVEEVNYLSRVEDLRVFPFTLEALTLLKDAGYLIVVVTNQSGIGRGIYSEEAMHSIHRQMDIELPGLIDAYHFCPHLPDAGCACRKPGTGMFESADSRFAIDRSVSWMVGDKVLDIEAGVNAGTHSALVKTGYGASTARKMVNAPDIIGEDLLDVVKQIVAKA